MSTSAALFASEQTSELLSSVAVLWVKLVESAAVISNNTFTFGCWISNKQNTHQQKFTNKHAHKACTHTHTSTVQLLWTILFPKVLINWANSARCTVYPRLYTLICSSIPLQQNSLCHALSFAAFCVISLCLPLNRICSSLSKWAYIHAHLYKIAPSLKS